MNKRWPHVFSKMRFTTFLCRKFEKWNFEKSFWHILTYVNKYAENGYTNHLAWNLQKWQVFDKIHFVIFYMFYNFCIFGPFFQIWSIVVTPCLFILTNSLESPSFLSIPHKYINSRGSMLILTYHITKTDLSWKNSWVGNTQNESLADDRQHFILCPADSCRPYTGHVISIGHPLALYLMACFVP